MTKLRVRRLESEDLPTRVAWFNTPSVAEQMPVDYPLCLESTRQWFSRITSNAERRDFCFLETAESTHRPVAMGGITNIDRANRRGELYILTDPAATGRGYGSWAVSWLCDFAFVHLACHKVYLFTVEGNHRARGLYERLGFRAEGVLREHLFHRGRLIDRHIHGLLHNEWEDRSWRTKALLESEDR